MYYCEVDNDGKLTFHRAGKGGPKIATGDPSLEVEGQTNVHLFDPKSTILLRNEYQKNPNLKSKTSFQVDEKSYYWRGHNDLLDEETQSLIATFHPSRQDGSCHEIGRLEIMGEISQDIIVITALVVQERADELRLSVCTALGLLLIERRS